MCGSIQGRPTMSTAAASCPPSSANDFCDAFVNAHVSAI